MIDAVRRSRCAPLALAGILALGACASKREAPLDPQIGRCQEQASSARPERVDQSRLAVYRQDRIVAQLTARADAFAACLEGSGYAFDETAMDKELAHEERVWNANQLSGDPFWYLAKRKQELRLSPALWHPGKRS
jgi:hypothetical protein